MAPVRPRGPREETKPESSHGVETTPDPEVLREERAWQSCPRPWLLNFPPWSGVGLHQVGLTLAETGKESVGGSWHCPPSQDSPTSTCAANSRHCVSSACPCPRQPAAPHQVAPSNGPSVLCCTNQVTPSRFRERNPAVFPPNPAEQNPRHRHRPRPTAGSPARWESGL